MFANRVEGEKYTASIHAGFSAHEERERIKRMEAQYKHTPERILVYLVGPSTKVQKAFAFQDEEVVRRNIDYLLQHCSAITQLTPDGLLDKLDFQEGNTKNEEWFPALLAVMRTIMRLHEPLGFEKITPLPLDNTRSEADLLATRQGISNCLGIYARGASS